MNDAAFGFALRQARSRRGLSLRGLQGLVRYDFTYLGQVERGEKPGSLALAAACDDALTEEGRLLSAFRATVPESANVSTDVSIVGTMPGNMRSSGDRPTQSRGEGPLGRPVDMEYLRGLYHGTYSVDHLARAVRECLAVNSRDLETARSESARRRLLTVRADGALLAGRLALFDTWEPIAARGYLGMAREAATQAGDDALAAAACGHLAFVPARERLLAASADHLLAARRHAERSGVPALQSWVAAVEAELLGPARRDRGVRALDRAVAAMTGRARAETPPWFDFYSAARLEGFRGQVLLAAASGAAAREALTQALEDLEPDAVKQRAVLLADVAASSMCEPAPDIEQVAAEALRAATELGRTRYRAAAERLAALRARLAPWRKTPAVRALDEALADSVA